MASSWFEQALEKTTQTYNNINMGESQINPLYVQEEGSGFMKYIRHMDTIPEENGFGSVNGVVGGTMYDIESQLLRGTMSFSKNKLQELDPSYTGYTHIFCVRVPPVLTEAINSQIPNFDYQTINGNRGTGVESYVGKQIARQHCINLKVMMEMGATSYSGTPSLTLNTAQVPTGWTDRNYPAPTFSEFDSTDFSLKVLETRGEPLRRGIEYYISALSDPNLKAATMNGVVKNGWLLEPTLANFTWTFMIVQTDQTLLTIQDVSLWNSCIIKNVDRSNLDWDNGTIDIVQPRDVQFSGVYMPDCRNPYLHKMAALLLGLRMNYYKRFQDMGPEEIGTNQWESIGSKFEMIGNTEG